MLDWYERLAKRAMSGPGFTAAVILGCVARCHPPAASLPRPRLLPAHRPRPVRHQRHACPAAPALKSATTTSPKSKKLSASVVKPARPRHGRLQHRCPSRSLRHLYHQLRHGHRLRPDQPQGRTTASAAMNTCDRVRAALAREMPELAAYYQAGGLVDAVINQGCPPPSTSRSAPRTDRLIRPGPATGRQDPAVDERQRRLHSPEHRLPRPGTEH